MQIETGMHSLAEELHRCPAAFTIELVTFPSGAAMLDVRYRERLFVMVYSPSSGFGVDEVRTHEGLGIGYRE